MTEPDNNAALVPPHSLTLSPHRRSSSLLHKASAFLGLGLIAEATSKSCRHPALQAESSFPHSRPRSCAWTHGQLMSTEGTALVPACSSSSILLSATCPGGKIWQKAVKANIKKDGETNFEACGTSPDLREESWNTNCSEISRVITSDLHLFLPHPLSPLLHLVCRAAEAVSQPRAP